MKKDTGCILLYPILFKLTLTKIVPLNQKIVKRTLRIKNFFVSSHWTRKGENNIQSRNKSVL